MKSLISLILPTICLLISCSEIKTDNRNTPTNAPIKVAAFILKADSVNKQEFLPGEILPYDRVEIRSKVNGYVSKINVDIGSEVKKGDVIAVIEAPEIQSKATEASEKRLSAEAKFMSSKDNYIRLLEAAKVKGAISENDLQIAKNKMMSDSAEYKSALFAYQSYVETEGYLTITAPFNGTITKRNADVGTYVGNAGDKPIVVVENNNMLRLRVAIPEALVGIKLKDNKIQFTTRGIPDKRFTATLSRKAGSIDVVTRTEIWEFDINNETHEIKPGMFADVSITASREGKSLVVPYSAVLTTLERKVVIRINHGKAEWVNVSQGINMSDKAEIFGNVSAGDTLVLKANEELKAGTNVASAISN